MRVDDFDFQLPEENIALRPTVPRDSARLLVVNDQKELLLDRMVGDLRDFLREGDGLVFNDTRVIPAQLEGTRQRGEFAANIGATLHMRTAPGGGLHL